MANTAFEELKVEAEALGLKVPGNISKAKLQAKVNEVKARDPKETAYRQSEDLVEEKTKDGLTPKEKARLAGGKLKRVRITCNDPQFKKLPGIVRAAGSTLYFKKRYIPFNKITHIEQVLYDFLKKAEYQWFEEKVNRTTGRKYKISRISPAFVIEDLPDLTKEELEELARDQQARGAIGDDE